MISNFLVSMTLFPMIALNGQMPLLQTNKPLLASHDLPLNDRYSNGFVNNVFKDNILLTLDYLNGVVQPPSQINWQKVEEDKTVEFTLKPGETFSFHDDVLPEFKGQVVETTHAHFNYQEGFKSDGFLSGDGVCHLASLINWTAKDAGLKVIAPTSHDFANIPDIARQYGTAIYFSPGQSWSNEKQNLYVTNNFNKPVIFKFDYKNSILNLSILESN